MIVAQYTITLSISFAFVNYVNKNATSMKLYAGSGADKFVINAGSGTTTIIGFGASDQISRGSTLLATDVLNVKVSGNDTLISKGDNLL